MKFLDEHGISAELRSIIENTNDLMFIKNLDWVYIAVSRTYALDCMGCKSVEDVIGKTDFDLFEDSDIVAQYRADNEALLASGKSMAEFREVFPGKNGKKLYCTTTKYLLHDKTGKPVALFGVYHDIGEQVEAEIKRRRDINKNVANALGRSFFVANYADLRTHRYVTIQTVDYAKKMMENCETIEQGFASFIHTLVKPEYQEEMRRFCDSATLAQRVKGKPQIECVYMSRVAIGWCKASLYPCEWDEDGEVTHVLFVVAPVAEKIAQEIEEGLASKRDLSTIFDVSPVGITVYKWNGKKLTFLSANHCYKEFFDYDTLRVGDEPRYAPIHRDDLDGYKKAVYKALTETHHLEYAFRIWNKEKNRYGWLQINAVAKPQINGTSLVYAIFTDVSDRKIAEMRLEKSRASVLAALGASEQYSYEYDPVMHTGTTLLKNDSVRELDTVIQNFPECFREMDLIHPDDVEQFIETTHRMDEGAESAHCVIRVKKDGKIRWHSCTFDALYDWEKEYRIAMLTAVDITSRVAAKQDYEERIQSLLSVQENILSMCTINVTRDTYKMVHTEEVMSDYVNHTPGFESTMMKILPDMVDEESRNLYRKMFSRENLLNQAALGNTHHQQEFLMKLSEDRYEWVTAVVELVKNPLTDEISGVAYSKSTQKSHMERDLLGSALKMDYLIAAIVFKDTDEFYIYNSEADSFGDRKEHFWDVASSRRSSQCSQETIAYLNEFFSKERMCSYLDSHTEFSYAFDSDYLDQQSRLNITFRYLDKRHSTFLFTLRDITDQRLQEQWKHDSEHDALTGLLNRKMVFEESRNLLNQHPGTQFAILHCDVRHFHLYNTFFGEEAGDKLLCRIAEVIQSLQKDYSFFTCGRIESDVFCVCFPLQKDVFEEHIRLCFRELEAFSPDFPLDLAVGVYLIEDPTMSIEAMFSRATIAAKSGEKNLFGLISRYDDAMDQNLKDTQQITGDMVAAIEQEQFAVYLQPKYSLRSNSMVGAEALVRWQHPERGTISPGKIIPVFERNGFIANLDRYMWEHVCMVLRRWQDEGKPMYPVSVNISRVSMYSRATVPFLKSLVEKYALSPKYLELELTESAYMDDPEDLKRMLKELQDYGFKILMDDFGSGYSSLNTLRDLPVDILKLDMNFLSTEQDDVRGNAVLSSVVRMSKLLNLPIVAEGVETQEQADYLRSIGCEYVQGYLFAKPMPIADFEALLTSCKKHPETPEKEPPISEHPEEIVLEEPLYSLGLLEYDKECFAFLRTNKTFLQEFGLINNLNSASRVFRDHLDEKSFQTLLQVFANCSEKKTDTVCSLQWTTDDGKLKKYHGYVHYHGDIGNYADLAVVFVNVTDIDWIGFDAPVPEVDAKRISEVNTDATQAMVRALDNTGVRTFMYYPQSKIITVPEKACQAYHCRAVYENMPQSFADDFVYEDDHRNFNEMYYAIDRGEKTATAIFHSKDLNYCHHVTLTTVSWLENGQPNEAVGIIEDMSEPYKNEKLVNQLKEQLSNQSIYDEVEDALKTMATSIGNQYYAVYYIWLESDTFICFQEQQESMMTLIGERGTCKPAWALYIDNYTDPRDRKGMREFVETATLADRIGYRNSISFNYRRKGIGWTRGQFIVGKRDEHGKVLTVVYTVTDINEEVETKQQKQQAEYEALHDPLTKMWNRKAFEQFIEDPDYKHKPVGLLLFDIDEFKGFNDQFGHQTGDRIICEVSQAVRGVLREKDLIFRMGGDEFAVLLYNCNESIWDIICHKIESIHFVMKNSLSSGMKVTLSAGLCLSDTGYCDELYNLADQAMYNTKEHGRGGCTLTDSTGEFKKEWHDQSNA